MKIITTLLRSINFDDESYRLSSSQTSSLSIQHAESINRIGILHPPIIKESNTGMYIIASGRKRLIHAKKQLNQSQCSCLVIPEKYDQIKTWSVILEDMLLHAPLTAIEKAEFFQKILPIIDIKEVATLFAPMLDLKPHTFQIKQLLPLAQLAEPLKTALQQGTLDLKAALQLASLSFRDSLALFDMINHLHLSVGNQRKFITTIIELSKRNDKNILSQLTTADLQKIIDSSDNIPQKSAHIMRYLSQQLTPQLTQAENNFRNFVNTLKLPEAMNLSHEQSFENESLSLSITFKKKAQFLQFWETQRKSLA